MSVHMNIPHIQFGCENILQKIVSPTEYSYGSE
jgi:hypothetical protein